MSSSQDRDVEVNLSVPIIVLGQDGKSPECPPEDTRSHGPWKPGAGLDQAKDALAKTGALLDVLQKAQREGLLAPAGVAALESLLRFYAGLKAQLDART